jgi:hypothetical protein
MILFILNVFMWYITGGFDVWSDYLLSESVYNAIQDALLYESILSDERDYLDPDYIIGEPVIFSEATWEDSDET